MKKLLCISALLFAGISVASPPSQLTLREALSDWRGHHVEIVGAPTIEQTSARFVTRSQDDAGVVQQCTHTFAVSVIKGEGTYFTPTGLDCVPGTPAKLLHVEEQR